MIARPLAAQDTVYKDTLYLTEVRFSPLNGNDLATTICLGGKVLSVIRIDALESRLGREIVAHEKIHIRQLEEMIALNRGQCPVHIAPERLLAMEIEAYCGVRGIRMATEPWVEQEAVDVDYIDRLQNGFKSYFSLGLIASQYRLGCE